MLDGDVARRPPVCRVQTALVGELEGKDFEFDGNLFDEIACDDL